MINNNKILTVSYGTFSCTLEGFDDSFGTMKAIAEYFRDLASDDRYFGAEPPQPDAQMLARIAQREISRNVEARQDDGRIVLSARETEQAASVVASDVVEDVAAAVADATVAKAKTDEPQLPAVEAPYTAAEDMQDDAVEESDDDYAEEPEVSIEDETSIEVTASDELPDHADDAPTETTVQVDEPDIVPSLPDADVEAFFADREEKPAEIEDADEAVDEPTQERARADSIADKLKRIRAVVSQQTDAQAAPDYSEDQHADAGSIEATAVEMPSAEAFAEDEDTADVTNDVLTNTLRDLEDALDADDEMDTAQELDKDAYSDEAEDEDEDITAILNRLDDEADSADLAADEAEFDTDSFDDTDEMGGNILAAMDTVEAIDDAEDDNFFDVEETAPKAEEPKPAAPRTRVLKVKRATLEAAIRAGKLEEYDDEEENEAQDQAAVSPLRKAPLADSSSLSDEAEEDLARELAELEADMAAEQDQDLGFEYEAVEFDTVEEALEELAEEESPEDEDASAARAEIRTNADADLSRLMEETKLQMEEPESATRRDAFSHLRAAVAAKKADEAVGGSLDDEETDEAYRDDLASVVRPRRPVSGERGRTERPSEQRPAPLKLVAEQRIDVSEPSKVVPVRPRRVAAVAPQPAPVAKDIDAASFTDFASEMGAESLPDLLEAAAAYLSFVEGHEQFSRPQLMTKVRQVEQENFTREDSLRSFGKLLREGKIEKLKGGRFQASEQIGFKPDARAVG